MLYIDKFKLIIFKYKKTFEFADIKQGQYYLVIFLTFLTVGLDAIGIGILLPIGEYILNYSKGTIPDTYSWKVIKNVFDYFGLKVNIIFIVLAVFVIIILRQATTFLRSILTDLIKLQAARDFREKLFFKFIRQDIYHMKKHSTGVLNNIINLEVDNLSKAIVLPLENISGLILVISYLCLMMVISIPATVIVLVCIFSLGFFFRYLLHYIEKISGKLIKVNNSFSQNIVDRLVAIKLIRINNMEEKEKKINKSILKDQFSNNIKIATIQRVVDSIVEPLMLMIAIPIIVLAIKLDFPLAKLGIFIILLARFIPSFKLLITGIQRHAVYFATLKNMLNLIDLTNKQKEVRTGSEKAPKIIKKIEFKNITFSYKGSNTNILKNFSCIIKGGKINGIIGKSGLGKTTLVNMIPRLIEPKIGNIYINEKNLFDIDVGELRNICAYIEQKPIFLRGSIIEHITYNNSKINMAQVKEATRLTKSDDFIKGLPDQYFHELGESGTGLSGGQLQRLDIARGIASKKPIMILDEPTSNLDNENAKGILLTLKSINKFHKTTIILVTHDNKALKYCDHIIKI